MKEKYRLETIFRNDKRLIELVKQMVTVQKLPVVVNAVKMKTDFQIEDSFGGWMNGKKGDWLVRGIGGEFYPVDKKIFVKTYKIVKGE
jgi:hypothetical protein